MKQLSLGCLVLTAMIASPWIASAQQAFDGAEVSRAQGNVPGQARQAESAVSSAVRKWGIGVDGGVGLNPELIMFGAHGTFGPIFKPEIQFRPGFEFGVGELTTLFGINLDVTYAFSGDNGRWTPYLGAGPNFTLSHKGLSSDDVSGSTTTTVTTSTNGTTTTNNRFNFSDTDFSGGFNFIAGARRDKLFVEMKATAYGVKNVRLMAGFNF